MQTASGTLRLPRTKTGETFHEAHLDGLDTSWDSPAGHWDPPRGKEGWDLIDFSPETLTWHLENTAWKSSFPFEMAPFLKGDMSVFAGVNVNEWWFQINTVPELLTVRPWKWAGPKEEVSSFQLLIFRRAKILDSGRVGVVGLPVAFNSYDEFSVLMGHSCLMLFGLLLPSSKLT